MQTEILAANPQSRIRISGVNAANSTGGNGVMTLDRSLPWCQDAGDVDGDTWAAWGVANRDVVVLDRTNAKVAVYNCTVNDLADPDNYAELLAILRSAAGE
jgi:hypothetical protein